MKNGNPKGLQRHARIARGMAGFRRLKGREKCVWSAKAMDGAEMGKQSELFLRSEAAAWLKRNEHKLPPKEDPILDMITRMKLEPKIVLEIGCANGWRLDKLMDKYHCDAFGIDPCIEHPTQTTRGAYLMPGTAENIITSRRFDLVIFGYCLYLCDPEDYFRIAQQSDAALLDRGNLIIFDCHTTLPYDTTYAHQFGVLTRKMDFAQLWPGHPYYKLVARYTSGQNDERTAVTILRKDIQPAFPVRT